MTKLSDNGRQGEKETEKLKRGWKYRIRPGARDGGLRPQNRHLDVLLNWEYLQIPDLRPPREYMLRSALTCSGTPLGDIPIPNFSSEQMQTTLDMSQDQFDQTRHANVQTLNQMFPALDEEIVEAVLEGCGDDLGVAIDRLLEM
jgi:hypothetical protein